MTAPTRKTTAGTDRATKSTTATRKSTTRKSATASIAAAVTKTIADRKMARPRGWNRDALVAFFVNEWTTLPAYSAAALSAESRARHDVRGFVVPAECYTPGVPVDQSAVNSVRAYIGNVVLEAMALTGCANVPAIGAVATMLEERDGVACCVVYRKA